MNPFAIKDIAIALALGLTVGFSAGFYTESKFVKADQIDAVTEAQHQTAQGIEQSLEISSAVEAKVAASSQSNKTIRKVVARQITKRQESSNVASLNQNHACDSDVLSLGAVSLLNSARAGTPPDAAFVSDAKSEAPSGIGLAELADGDLEVVDLYHELSTRHDALVDYVEDLIQKQTK